MAEITAALIKTLRERTGAGMMDCKRALTENAGDVEQSVDWLRKKGLAAAAKKAGRVAAEGLVGVVTAGRVGAAVEVNSETDFVARNEKFQEFVSATTAAALRQGDDVAALSQVPLGDSGNTVGSALTALVATIGENMTLRRAKRLEVSQGVVVGYVHNALAPGLGKIGVLIALESSADDSVLTPFGKDLAMHVAAAAPLFLDTGSVDPVALERERAVHLDKAQASGKPEAIVAKMVEGSIRKYYEAAVLLEQDYVKDDSTKIGKLIETTGKAVGHPIRLAGFVRFLLGEGIEKEGADFADEVAAVLKG